MLLNLERHILSHVGLYSLAPCILPASMTCLCAESVCLTVLCAYLLSVSIFFASELIYKEVLDWEDRMKSSVIRGQPPPLG